MPTLEKRLSDAEAAAREPWSDAWRRWHTAVFEPMDVPPELLALEDRYEVGGEFDAAAEAAAVDLLPRRWRAAGGWRGLDDWFNVEVCAIVDAAFPESDAPPALNLYPSDIPAPPIVPTLKEVDALEAEAASLTSPRGYSAASMRILAGIARRHALHTNRA